MLHKLGMKNRQVGFGHLKKNKRQGLGTKYRTTHRLLYWFRFRRTRPKIRLSKLGTFHGSFAREHRKIVDYQVVGDFSFKKPIY